MEHVDCIICGEDRSANYLVAHDIRLKTTEDPFQLVECGRCGLIYLNPMPSKDDVARYYPASYRKGADLAASAVAEKARKFKAERLSVFFKNPWHIKDIPKGCTALDIGCGQGELAFWLRDAGCDVVGVDVNDRANQALRENTGLNIITCNVDEGLPFRDGFFDYVFMRHSLEHFIDPLNALVEVRRVIKPNGRLLIGVPNAGSAAARATREFWTDLDVPRHLFHFTPSSIRALLEKAGFGVLGLYFEPKLDRKGIRLFLESRKIPLYPFLKHLLWMTKILLCALGRSDWMVIRAQKIEKTGEGENYTSGYR